MSDKHNEQTDEAMRAERETVPVKSAQALARRRWLRSGLKATPVVVASLAARPALAWHCIAPSAWGSINFANGDIDQEASKKLSGSLTRFQSVRFETGTYRFSDFAGTSGDGWKYLKRKFSPYPERMPDEKKILYLQGTYKFPADNGSFLTVQGLCAGLGIHVPSGSENSKALEMIQSKGFGASMLIALINEKRGKLPLECVTVNGGSILAVMATGSYTPDGLDQTWDKNQIADYLHYNWLARR